MSGRPKIEQGANYAGGRQKPVKAFYPEMNQDEAVTTRPTVSAGSPWYPVVTDKDILYLIRRDELAYKTLFKWAGACFNKWGTFTSESEPLIKAWNELMKKVEFRDILKRAYLMTKAEGVALIVLGYNEASGGALDKSPVIVGNGLDRIGYIHAVPKTSIEKIDIDKNPASENYGKIKSFILRIPTVASDQLITVDASRVLHWPNQWVDDDPWGISMFEPLFDKFTVKKNLDFAMGEVPRQQAKSLPVMSLPGDADDDEVTSAKQTVANINVYSGLVKPTDYEFKYEGTSGALNPKPYADYVLSTLAAGSTGSKVALLGTEAGAVTGSEVNLQEWYSAVSDEQRNFIQPIIDWFVQVMQENGILPPGDLVMTWATLYEMDEMQKAEIQLKRSQALQAIATAMTLLRAQQIDPQITPDGVSFITPEGQKVTVPVLGINEALVMSPSRPRPRPSSGRNQGAGTINTKARVYLPPDAAKKLFAKWELKTTGIENAFTGAMMGALVGLQTDFMEYLKDVWENTMGPIDADPTGTMTGKNDESEFIEEMDGWEPDLKDIRAIINEFVTNAYTVGTAQTMSDMGIKTGPVGAGPNKQVLMTSGPDTATRNMLIAKGMRFAKDTYLDMEKGAIQAILKGLEAREGYALLNNRVAEAFGNHSKGFPASVQKVVHEAASEARFDTLKKRGVDKVIYTTAMDDRVREEHAALQGVEMERDEAMQYLADWGCRCTVVPVTLYDEAVKEAEEGD